MFFDIDLTTEPADVALRDIDNFRAFQIEARGPRERIADAVAQHGRWDGEYAWFRPEAVRAAAGARAYDAGWQAGFEAMSAYAAEHGYLADDGALRAHVEWRE